MIYIGELKGPQTVRDLIIKIATSNSNIDIQQRANKLYAPAEHAEEAKRAIQYSLPSWT